MKILMSDEIKVGDTVEHVDGIWDRCEIVRDVFNQYDADWVRFEAGGFWLLSRLRKVKSDGK